jgi:AGZA family xanthine/uracil permease-like MFS transporter
MTKIGKYVPSQSISGFLLVIGGALTLVPNMTAVTTSEAPLEGIVAAGVTVITNNAFIGLVAGVIVKLTGSLLGIV